MYPLCERCEMHTLFWSENVKERDQSEELHVDGRIIIECVLEKWVEKLYTGCIWLRTETSGDLL
jgi:hypothetical protein